MLYLGYLPKCPSIKWLIDWLMIVFCWVWTLTKSLKPIHGFTLDLSLAFRWGLRELCWESTKYPVTVYRVGCGRKPVTAPMAEFARSAWTWRFLMGIAWTPLVKVKVMDNRPGHILEGLSDQSFLFESIVSNVIWSWGNRNHQRYSQSLAVKSQTINFPPWQSKKNSFHIM